MNGFRRLISFIMGVILMFIATQIYFSLKQDVLTQEIVSQETENLADTISEHGKISESMLTTFLKKLSNTEQIYDLDIVHKKLNLEPEYRFKTADEIINEQNSNFTGSNIYTYREVFSEIPIVNDNEPDNSVINTETSAKQGASSDHIHDNSCYREAGTSENPICNNGYMRFVSSNQFSLVKGDMNDEMYRHYYYKSGTDGSGIINGDLYFYHTIYQCTECGKYLNHIYIVENHSNTEFNSFLFMSDSIPKLTFCRGSESTDFSIASVLQNYLIGTWSGYWYYYSGIALGSGSPSGNPFYKVDYISIDACVTGIKTFLENQGYVVANLADTHYNDTKVEYNLNFDRNSGSYNILLTNNVLYLDRDLNTYSNSFVDAYGSTNLIFYIYSTRYDLCKHFDILSRECLCDKIIDTIVPTHPNQIIYKGSPIITTAVVTYKDGSSEVVKCDCVFDVNHIGLNQTAVLSYFGLNTANSHLTFTKNILVTVLAMNKVCSNSHTYWLNDDGSDPGCPYCNSWLYNLSLINPSSGYLEITQGTALEDSGLMLLATYLDGHQENVTTGYVHNLDNIYIGQETVTIGYKGKYLTINVRVNRKKKNCSICGREYELYPDGSDPGCPYCMALIPIFAGNVMSYYTEIPMTDILNSIEENGLYQMSRGDEILIKVNNRSKTFSSRILSFLGIDNSNRIKVWNVTEIRDN